MLVADSFFDDLDFFVGQPVQFVDDLVDQLVRLLDFSSSSSARSFVWR